MTNKGYGCCEEMKKMDKKGILDYGHPHLTTIDVEGVAYIINYCPWCGKHLTNTTVERINKYFKE